MEDGVDVSAGGFEAETEGAPLFIQRRGGHAEEAKGEVLGFGFGVVPHHPGHREPPAERNLLAVEAAGLVGLTFPGTPSGVTILYALARRPDLANGDKSFPLTSLLV
jgi:hypothetical protein